MDISDYPSADEAVASLSGQLTGAERSQIPSVVEEITGGDAEGFLEMIFEMNLEDIESYLASVMEGFKEAEIPEELMGVRLRVIWFLWCSQFADNDAILAHVQQNVPAEAGLTINYPTDYMGEELRKLLAHRSDE